jgi:DNA-binding transcriptional MocR family regulator
VTSFPPGTRVDSGEGGYQLWVELPESLDAGVLLEASRRRGYTFVPGAVFSTGTQFDHCLRLTAGHPLDESHFRGIQALGAIADQLLKSRASNKRTRKARTAIVA